MNTRKRFAATVAAGLLIATAAQALPPQGQPTGAAAKCAVEANNEYVCRADATGPAPKMAQGNCVFTCSKSGTVWICRGNGPQCNGKSPWN